MAWEYEDIIALPHPEPKNHVRMTILNRAGQFAPFAALTGYDDAVEETARLTDARGELDEDERERLDRRLRLLALPEYSGARVTIVYFRPDSKKEGGRYEDILCSVSRLDTVGRAIVTDGGLRLSIEDIFSIEGEVFDAAGL